MPFLNSRGQIAHGKLGFGACLDNVQFAPGGEACWYNDDTIVYIHDASGVKYLAFYDVNTHVITPVDAVPRRPAAVLMANNYSHWVASDPTLGIFSDAGFVVSAGVLKGIGPGGSIAYNNDPFTACKVREVTNSEYVLSTNAAAADVKILGDRQAIWVESSVLKALDMPTLVLVGSATGANSGITQPKAILVAGKWWLCYRSTTKGVVLHPHDDVNGYLMPGGARFDIVLLNPTTIRYAYGTSANESVGQVNYVDVDLTTVKTVLGPRTEIAGDDGTGSPDTDEDGMKTLSSTATYAVAGAASELVSLPVRVWPSYPVGGGYGRIVHPVLGTFDYEVKPDEWVNIDADAIISPVWASTRTLTSAANVLWDGNIRDVVVEERWKALGGLAMPVTQLRMLLAIWTTPVDPDVGYVQWFPSYITPRGFNVLPVGLQSGNGGITFDDVVNYKDENGDPIGWMTAPVTFTLKLVGHT